MISSVPSTLRVIADNLGVWKVSGFGYIEPSAHKGKVQLTLAHRERTEVGSFLGLELGPVMLSGNELVDR